MAERVHYHSNLIFPVGTQVVSWRDIIGQNRPTLHPGESMGVVVKPPSGLHHTYRIRFPDGVEESMSPRDLVPLARFKEGEIGDHAITVAHSDLFGQVIFQCIIGSQAYGLAESGSDIDRRGFYLPLADPQPSNRPSPVVDEATSPGTRACLVVDEATSPGTRACPVVDEATSPGTRN